MKKHALQILAESQERQLVLDQLNKTVQEFQNVQNGDAFDGTAKTAVMADVVLAINKFRTAVEARLFAALSKSYTNTAYVAFTYTVATPVPSFQTVSQVQAYYSPILAKMIADITAEGAEANFINDGLGQGTNQTIAPSNTPKPVGNASNIVVAKGATWTAGEAYLVTRLGLIQAELMAYVPLS